MEKGRAIRGSNKSALVQPPIQEDCKEELKTRSKSPFLVTRILCSRREKLVPAKTRKRDSPEEEAEPCGVCYNPIKLRGAIESCKHQFCFECIHRWSKSEGDDKSSKGQRKGRRSDVIRVRNVNQEGGPSVSNFGYNNEIHSRRLNTPRTSVPFFPIRVSNPFGSIRVQDDSTPPNLSDLDLQPELSLQPPQLIGSRFLEDSPTHRLQFRYSLVSRYFRPPRQISSLLDLGFPTDFEGSSLEFPWLFGRDHP